MIGIKQDIEEKFGRHVDIVRYRETMNPFLKKRIDSEAVYV
jgi:predicted nucleotidyltransferase